MKSIHRHRCSAESNHQNRDDGHRKEIFSWPAAITYNYMKGFKNRGPTVDQDFMGGGVDWTLLFCKKPHSQCWDTGTA